MALTYDQISSITSKKFIPKMVDNIFDSNPLLQRMKAKAYDKIDGGERIMMPLNYAAATASGWYSGTETLDTSDNAAITAAEYLWKTIYASIVISRLDELKNSGDSQIVSLVKAKTQIAEKTMADSLGSALFNTGTNAKAPGGLGLMVSTSSTVGGISQSSYSWWQAQVDSTTTTLTMKALQHIFNHCTVGNDGPSCAVTTRTLFDSYYSLLQPQQRFQDSQTAKGGFQSLMFNGIPVLCDSHQTANYLHFVNEDYFRLVAHKDEDMRFEPFAKPINQNVKVAKVFWAGNVCTSNCRMLGGLTALTS